MCCQLIPQIFSSLMHSQQWFRMPSLFLSSSGMMEETDNSSLFLTKMSSWPWNTLWVGQVKFFIPKPIPFAWWFSVESDDPGRSLEYWSKSCFFVRNSEQILRIAYTRKSNTHFQSLWIFQVRNLKSFFMMLSQCSNLMGKALLAINKKDITLFTLHDSLWFFISTIMGSILPGNMKLAS